MTEKHGCEWELRTSVYVSAQIFKCKVLCCNKKLTVRQAEARLNEYETLKAATERLSAEDARYAIGRIKAHGEWWWNEEEKAMFSLNAYANILEGKDD